MNNIARRIRVLEGRYHLHEDRPARIPDWVRPWVNPLADADLEILEVAG